MPQNDQPSTPAADQVNEPATEYAVQSEFRQIGHRKPSRWLQTDRDRAVDRALTLIATGASTYKAAKILKVPQRTLVEWLERPATVDQYMRACVNRAAFMAESALTVVDDLVTDPDPRSRMNRAHVRMWFASRMDPKRWGAVPPAPADGNATDKALQALGAETLRQALARIAQAGGVQVLDVVPVKLEALPHDPQ